METRIDRADHFSGLGQGFVARKRIQGVLFLACLLAPVVLASELGASGLYIFRPAEPIASAEINQNFVTLDERIQSGGSPALGTDMLNQWSSAQGLFRPHTNTCDPTTEAYVAIADGSIGFCIEKNERAAAAWEDARAQCAAQRKRLLEPWEFKYACKRAGTLGLYAVTNNTEWASNFAVPIDGRVAAIAMGFGTCLYAGYGSIGGSATQPNYEDVFAFRCTR